METTVIAVIGLVLGFLQAIMIYILTGIKAEIADVWRRMNNHYHEVSCDNDDCKRLVTGNVIIPGGRE